MPHLKDTMIPAKDFLALRKFYLTVLGFDVIESFEDSIKLGDRKTGQNVVITNGSCIPGLSLGIEAKDVPKLLAKIEAGGGRVGEGGVCYDPEGNPLMIWKAEPLS